MTKDMQEHLSPHFSLYMLTRDGFAFENELANVPDSKTKKNLKLLCESLLEPLYKRFGTIVVVRGFLSRMIAMEEDIDPASAYCRGKAVDIVCSDMNQAHCMYQFIKNNLPFKTIDYIESPSGLTNCIHIEVG